MYILSALRQEIVSALMFVPFAVLERPWTLVTYMFLHDGTLHLLFNMLGLFFFGPRLEEELGGKDFLLLYFISGITGALLSFLTPNVAIVGASGAVYGIFLGFARYWPREQIYIWGILPVEARTLVIVMTVLSLMGGFTGGGNIAHFAHLGGFVGGWIFLRTRDARVLGRRRQWIPPTLREPSTTDLQRWQGIDRNTMHPVNREEYDRIIQKLNSSGPASLTDQERTFLDRFS
jgi:membrane associated rhomboid family serine protease